MAGLGFELEEIAKLIRLVETHALTELVVEEAGSCIVIRGAHYAHARRAPPGESAQGETSVHPPSEEASSGRLPVKKGPSEELLVVRAPMTGVFYRAAGPDSPPFVEEGDYVEAGQTIGIIEAMKVFSEIPSDFSGIVVEVVAKNNQLVRENDPLLYLRPQ
jgi:acetyl-CoA carboxylase biotin carboxyl carrier protein